MTLCITNQIVHIWLYCACGCSCIQVTSTRRLNSMSSAHEKIGRSQYCDITIYEGKNHAVYRSFHAQRSHHVQTSCNCRVSSLMERGNLGCLAGLYLSLCASLRKSKVRSLRRDCGSCYPCQCAGSRRCRRSPHHRPATVKA